MWAEAARDQQTSVQETEVISTTQLRWQQWTVVISLSVLRRPRSAGQAESVSWSVWVEQQIMSPLSLNNFIRLNCHTTPPTPALPFITDSTHIQYNNITDDVTT